LDHRLKEAIMANITLTLNDQQQQVLHQLLDAALRNSGLGVISGAFHFVSLIEDAKNTVQNQAILAQLNAANPSLATPPASASPAQATAPAAAVPAHAIRSGHGAGALGTAPATAAAQAPAPAAQPAAAPAPAAQPPATA
jgi:hypothetical protein